MALKWPAPGGGVKALRRTGRRAIDIAAQGARLPGNGKAKRTMGETQMTDSETALFLSLFPIAFVGMWLFITTMLGMLSGWFALQGQFDRGDEAPLVTFRHLSGSMGLGVNLNGILTLSACPSGLRVAIWRMFGPFQRPFLVPWAEISPEQKTRFFVPLARLGLGSPEVGKLVIDAGIWQKLAAHAPAGRRTTAAPLPLVTNQQLARGLALQWAVISGIAIAFFTFILQLPPGAPPMLLAIFTAFPVIAFGIAQLTRYRRQRS